MPQVPDVLEGNGYHCSTNSCYVTIIGSQPVEGDGHETMAVLVVVRRMVNNGARRLHREE
jgi:hypothetical protein